MDVKSAFVNVVIQEEVFVRQPPDFKNPKYHNRVYKFSKALYGLKQGRGHGIIGLRLSC
jgi:hypothetical protein